MKTVNILEAVSRFPMLLAAVEERGETVLICRDGIPVAELKAPVVHSKTNRLKPGPGLKPISIRYDPVEPLSKDEWPSEYQ